jgi:hypothetical protein
VKSDDAGARQVTGPGVRTDRGLWAFRSYRRGALSSSESIAIHGWRLVVAAGLR